MPRGQPFTRICQQIAQLQAEAQRADLHLHTNHSDGVWTPAEVVRRAANRGLGAIAITDHDTCSALPEAQATARSVDRAPEIIAGVEITCEFRGRELHLLGYFFDPHEPALNLALAALRSRRRERFMEMTQRLSSAGLNLDEREWNERIESGHTLGRRDLATMLVRQGHAATVSEAFARYLRDGGPVAVPKRGLPVGDAIALVHQAGGVTSWAHPPQDLGRDWVQELCDMGLDALEAAYPTFTAERERQLRQLARELNLAISGGSDCHGPVPVSRALGSWGVKRAELEALRTRLPNGEKPVRQRADLC